MGNQTRCKVTLVGKETIGRSEQTKRSWQVWERLRVWEYENDTRRKSSGTEKFQKLMWNQHNYLSVTSRDGFLILWWIGHIQTLYIKVLVCVCVCACVCVCVLCEVHTVQCRVHEIKTEAEAKCTMIQCRLEMFCKCKIHSRHLAWFHSIPSHTALCWHIQYRPWQCEKEKPSRSVVLRKTQSSCAAGCIENEAWIIREEQWPRLQCSYVHTTKCNAKLLWQWACSSLKMWLYLPKKLAILQLTWMERIKTKHLLQRMTFIS